MLWKSFSSFKNLTFVRNENINKISCGTIFLENNIKLEIDQSKFILNKSYSEGGVMWVFFIKMYYLSKNINIFY